MNIQDNDRPQAQTSLNGVCFITVCLSRTTIALRARELIVMTYNGILKMLIEKTHNICLVLNFHLWEKAYFANKPSTFGVPHGASNGSTWQWYLRVCTESRRWKGGTGRIMKLFWKVVSVFTVIDMLYQEPILWYSWDNGLSSRQTNAHTQIYLH